MEPLIDFITVIFYFHALFLFYGAAPALKIAKARFYSPLGGAGGRVKSAQK
jgi:hypothetical protein